MPAPSTDEPCVHYLDGHPGRRPLGKLQATVPVKPAVTMERVLRLSVVVRGGGSCEVSEV